MKTEMRCRDLGNIMWESCYCINAQYTEGTLIMRCGIMMNMKSNCKRGKKKNTKKDYRETF